MKIIEVIADATHHDTIKNIAEQLQVEDIWFSSNNEDDRIAARILVQPENRQKVLDRLQTIFQNAPIIVHYLRYHSLFFPNVHQISDLLVKVDGRHAIGYFLKGRVHMSEMIFQISRYSTGQKSEQQKKDILELFKQVYHYYGHAVKRAGGHYSGGKNEITILTEYVGTLTYFSDTIAKILQIKIPKVWLIDNLSRAMMILRQSH